MSCSHAKKNTEKKGKFGLTVCVFSMCVWPLGFNTSDTHEMTRAKGAENFSEHVYMHSQASPLETHPASAASPSGPELCCAALFLMADRDTDSVRCQTTATESQIQAVQLIPDIYTAPLCICLSQLWCVRACQACMSVQRHIFPQQDSHKSSIQNAW